MLSTSPSGQVNTVDHFKALRTAAIVIGAAFLLGGLESVQALLKGGSVSFGHYELAQTFGVSILSYLIDLLRRAQTDNTR
jgi:hypothetical protein